MRILTTNLNDSSGRNLVVAVTYDNGYEYTHEMRPNGRIYKDRDDHLDLVNIPEPRTYGDVLQSSGQGVNVTELDGKIIKLELV